MFLSSIYFSQLTWSVLRLRDKHFYLRTEDQVVQEANRIPLFKILWRCYFFYLIASLVTFTNSLTSNQSRFYRPYKLTVLSVDIYAYNDLEILRYDLWPCANEHRPCSTYDVCSLSWERHCSNDLKTLLLGEVLCHRAVHCVTIVCSSPLSSSCSHLSALLCPKQLKYSAAFFHNCFGLKRIWRCFHFTKKVQAHFFVVFFFLAPNKFW